MNWGKMRNAGKAATAVEHWKRDAALCCLLANAKNIPAISKLGEAALVEMASVMRKAACVAGDVIIRQFDEGDFFYIVAGGRFDATKNGEAGAVKSYEANGYFGELALLRNAPRAATVTCVEAGTLWALDRATFRATLLGHRIRESAQGIPFLSHLSAETLDQLADAMFEVRCQEGDQVIRQGEPGDNYYLIEEGRFEALVKMADGTEPVVKSYEEGEAFGERALMNNVPRAATVRCVGAEGGRLWALDRRHFRMLTLGKHFSTVESGPEEAMGVVEEEEEEEELGGLGETGKAMAKEASDAAAVESGAAETIEITYEDAAEKAARKKLKEHPTLKAILESVWEAAELRHTRLHQKPYMDFHLNLTRFLLAHSDEEDEFDAIDAFDLALADWERDTDRGHLPAIHEAAFTASLFEVLYDDRTRDLLAMLVVSAASAAC